MKYFIMRIDKNNRTFYKKNKCVDGWSTNKAECWAFSRQGAKNIIAVEERYIARGRNTMGYTFSMIPSNGEGKNE